jgi:hypothetical protein
VSDPSYQQHDFEPGIADNGLFWTIPIGAGMVEADPTTGTARFRGRSVKVTDYHDFFNAVFGGGPTPLPARATFDVRWAGGGESSAIRDVDYEFVGEYVTGPATISFAAFDERASSTRPIRT